MTTRFALYRAFDSDGELLYVGATVNPGHRFQTHSGRDWWLEVASITLERFAEWEDLAAAEREAIIREGPKYNVIHSAPTPWNHKARRPKGDGSFFRRADGMWVGRVRAAGRSKQVTSKDRATALRKFEELKRIKALSE